MHMRYRWLLVWVGALAVACSPTPAPQGSGPGPATVPAAPAEARTLVVAIRLEPSTIATRPLRQTGVGLYLPSRMFNAQVAFLDDHRQTQPYLIERLPELNSDDWRVFPDGGMETTYHLKPGLAWHDGTPFSADDFVFGWRVYSAPTLGQSGLAPLYALESVTAPDPRTVVIRWRQRYPDVTFVAGLNAEFPPLPRHLLEAPFQADQGETFANQSFWTRDYVGLGPYRLERWEPGAFLEAVAFPGHVLGRARIERLKLSFISDARTALANVLSGDVQLTDGTSVGLPEVGVLKTEWIARGRGDVLLHPNQWRAVHFQHRPDLTTPRSLLNPTVRKALAHAVDRQPLNDALYNGDGIPADSPVAPMSVWGEAAQRGAVAYPYDLRRSEQLMADAGFSRGADGLYGSPGGGRLTFEVKTNAASDNESEVSILASSWRQGGFDSHEAVLPAAQAQNPELRATFSGVFTNSQNCCESALLGLTTAAIPTADNRWTGGNRSGWSNAEFDRLVAVFSQTLDRAQRDAQMTQMTQILTNDVQSISLFIRAQPWVYVAELHGLSIAPPEGNMSWNMHQWELR